MWRAVQLSAHRWRRLFGPATKTIDIISLQLMLVKLRVQAHSEAHLQQFATSRAGGAVLQTYAFRSQMPQLLCDESSPLKLRVVALVQDVHVAELTENMMCLVSSRKDEVDAIAWTSAIGYSVLIPGFLYHLYSRQRVVMQTCRTYFAPARCDGDSVVLRITSLHAPDHEIKLQDTCCSAALPFATALCFGSIAASGLLATSQV